MVGKAKKLRENLANLFKAREAMTPNTKRKSPSVLSSRNLNTREAVNPTRESPKENSFIESKGKNQKKKNYVQLEQGREPLNAHSSSKKVNGNLNGESLHKEQKIKKNLPGNKKTKSGSKKMLDDSFSKPAGVKKTNKSKQTNEFFEFEEKNNLKSRNKAVNKKNLKHKTPKVLKQEELKTQNKSHKNNKDFEILSKNKNNQANKLKDTKAQKRNLIVTEEPERKKLKISKNLTPGNELEIWDHSDSINETDTAEEYSDSYSELESDYDTDFDDTFDLSGDEYESYDDDYSDEYSLSSSGKYSDDCSYEEYDSEEDRNFQDELCIDPEYELPKHEVEDLIVHNGLAVTYKLETHHGAEFDETNEESHIVELPNQMPVNTVKQHEAYSIENLRELELQYCEQKSQSKATLSDEECPSLISIEEDDEGFQLWTSGITMDDEIFSDGDCDLIEDSDESSTLSYSDVNRKYLQPSNSYDDSDLEEVEDDESNEKTLMQAFVIEAGEENSRKIQKFGDKTSSPVVPPKPNLSEIIRKANESSQTSNVKIVKAEIKNFDDDSINDYNSMDTNENLQDLTNLSLDQQMTMSFEKRSDLKDKHPAITQNVEESMNLTQITSEDSLTPEMVTDFVDEIGKNVENTIYQNESLELHSDQAKEVEITQKKSRIRTKFCNSIDSYYVLVLLKSPIFVYGTIKAKLITGSIEIYGYKLKPGEMVTLHSPRGCSAVPLKPTPSLSSSLVNKEELRNQTIADIEALSDEAEFNSYEVKQLLTGFDPIQDAILLLTRNEDASKIKYIFQQHVNENIYPSYIPLSRPFCNSENMLDCMVNATAEYPLEIPSQWHGLHLQKNSKFMFIGGKSVGKSTLLRYLLNKHISDFSRMLLIDLDIGQPEIFVPQTISYTLLDQPLLGPGFFFQIQPDKSFAVGHTNLVACAHTYMRAVIKLLQFCKTEPAYKDVPWLINTMGYNKGFGCELISLICAHLQPTDIVQLQSNKPINNFDTLFEPCVVGNVRRIIYSKPEYDGPINYQANHQLHIIQSAILQQSRYQREWQMSAKDMRYIMLLARLSAILPDEGEWINQGETFRHDLQKLKIVNLMERKADEMETLKSLEANLVYLCHSTTTSSNSTNYGDAQQNEALECLGLGIVRCIDYHAKQIFIMPAMPIERIGNVNCLALGEIPLPSSLLTHQNPDTKYNVPFVQVMNDEATSRAVKQFFYRT